MVQWWILQSSLKGMEWALNCFSQLLTDLQRLRKKNLDSSERGWCNCIKWGSSSQHWVSLNLSNADQMLLPLLVCEVRESCLWTTAFTADFTLSSSPHTHLSGCTLREACLPSHSHRCLSIETHHRAINYMAINYIPLSRNIGYFIQLHLIPLSDTVAYVRSPWY